MRLDDLRSTIGQETLELEFHHPLFRTTAWTFPACAVWPARCAL